MLSCLFCTNSVAVVSYTASNPNQSQLVGNFPIWEWTIKKVRDQGHVDGSKWLPMTDLGRTPGNTPTGKILSADENGVQNGAQ